MEQNQNQQQQFKCSGDCLNCRMNSVERKTQWQYCSAQFTYNTMRMMESMQLSLTAMQGSVNELAAKIEAIQNSEANVFDPTESSNQSNVLDENRLTEETVAEEELVSAIAQSGDGA